ncbi:unnamed protein product, partial [Ilex paraguariensis]
MHLSHTCSQARRSTIVGFPCGRLSCMSNLSRQGEASTLVSASPARLVRQKRSCDVSGHSSFASFTSPCTLYTVKRIQHSFLLSSSSIRDRRSTRAFFEFHLSPDRKDGIRGERIPPPQ